MAMQERGQERVYRWWSAVWFWVILFSGCMVAGATWFVPRVAMRTDISTTIAELGAVLFVVCGVYGILRASRSGVAVERDALRVRDIWRDRVIGWSDISDVVIAK